MGLGPFDRNAASGAQSGVAASGGPVPSGSLAPHSVVHNSAAVDPGISSPFEAPSLVAVPDLTASALPVTPHHTLSEHALISVDAASAALEAQSIPLRIVDARRATGYERLVKPVIDRVFALLLLVVCSPILFVVGVLVAVSLGRPIVLRQRRIGRGGEPFVLHKFRTMHPDRREERVIYDGPDRRVTHKHPDDPG